MDTNSTKHSVQGGSSSPPPPANSQQTPGSPPPAAAVKEAVAIAAGKKGVGQSDDDDGGKSTVRSNMLCYLYWLLVVLILGLISFTVWLSIQLARRHSVAIIAQQTGKFGQKEAFTFDDIFDPNFKPKTFDVQWVNPAGGGGGGGHQGDDDTDDEAYTYRSRDGGSLMIHHVKTNVTETLMDGSIFEELKTSMYYVSSDAKFVLLQYDVISRWRHSFSAKYTIYERRSRHGTKRLLDFPNDKQLTGKRLQYAAWAPTTSALVFVVDNNLYYQSDPKQLAKQLTFSGREHFVFNGVTDWLYEESILQTAVAHWWSTDSRYLCYASFNATSLPLFHSPTYAPPSSKSRDGTGRETPSRTEFAFPRAMDAVSSLATGQVTSPSVEASLYVVDTDNIDGRHAYIAPPDEFKTAHHYVIQVAWKDRRHVAVVWTNRSQNKSITRLCDAEGLACYNNLYRSLSDGWIDPLPPMLFLDNHDESYATILPHVEGETGSWNHLAIVNTKVDEDERITFLTMGQHEVTSIVGVDKHNGFIFYISTNGDPKRRHLFRVGLPQPHQVDSPSHPSHPSMHPSSPLCLSCNVSAGCQYVSAWFSPRGTRYVLACLGPAVPTYTLRSSINTLDEIVVLEDNEELVALLERKLLPEREFIEVQIGGKYRAWVEVLTPPGADNDEKAKKYPLLINAQDTLAGTQAVTERFEISWKTFLSSSEEVVCASVDGRGTTGRGNRFRHDIYRRLTTADVEDQLLAGLYLKTLDYVDPAKVAIWGWSYGALVTSHAVANETDIFPCGIAGSALTDIDYYDAAQYERLLGFSTLGDNRDGFDKMNIAKKVEYFRNKKYLMIHGTGDDGLAFAGSSRLVQALTDADIQFRFQLYADLGRYFSATNHRSADTSRRSPPANQRQSSPANQRHLYRLMTDFLKNDCYSYFWKHETQTWIVDRAVKKERFRIKQFCV